MTPPAAAAVPAPVPAVPTPTPAAAASEVPAGGASDELVKAALKEVAMEMKRYKKVMKAARKEHEARVANIVRGMAASAENME